MIVLAVLTAFAGMNALDMAGHGMSTRKRHTTIAIAAVLFSVLVILLVATIGPRAGFSSFGGACIAVVGAAFLLTDAGVSWVYFYYRRSNQPMDPPDDWGTAPHDRKWEEKAANLPFDSPERVRESAKAWAASIGTLLAFGGTISFVKGEDTFAKLSEAEGNFAFWLTLVAAVWGGLALLLATFAAQGLPQRYRGIDGFTLSEMTRARARRAADRLLASRVLTLIAAAAALAGFGIGWKSGLATEAPESTKVIATTEGGAVRCGELQASADGRLSIVVGEQSFPLGEGATVSTASVCPTTDDR